jgi:hypothetical protein
LHGVSAGSPTHEAATETVVLTSLFHDNESQAVLPADDGSAESGHRRQFIPVPAERTG